VKPEGPDFGSDIKLRCREKENGEQNGTDKISTWLLDVCHLQEVLP
jgi:hypothetical protein